MVVRVCDSRTGSSISSRRPQQPFFPSSIDTIFSFFPPREVPALRRPSLKPAVRSLWRAMVPPALSSSSMPGYELYFDSHVSEFPFFTRSSVDCSRLECRYPVSSTPPTQLSPSNSFSYSFEPSYLPSSLFRPLLPPRPRVLEGASSGPDSAPGGFSGLTDAPLCADVQGGSLVDVTLPVCGLRYRCTG